MSEQEVVVEQVIEVIEVVEDGDKVEILEIVDIEEYVKLGKAPPKAKKYRIRIDKNHYVVEVPKMSQQQLLILAGKQPVTQYQLFQKLRGGELKEIKPGQEADFTAPGVERFVTLPLDQGEG